MDIISEHGVSKQLANGPEADEQKMAPGASTETTPTEGGKPALVNGLS